MSEGRTSEDEGFGASTTSQYIRSFYRKYSGPSRECFLKYRAPLLSLALWAFGPKSYPELQVLAYGDFSSDGRYARYNFLNQSGKPSAVHTDPATQAGKAFKGTFRMLTKG